MLGILTFDDCNKECFSPMKCIIFNVHTLFFYRLRHASTQKSFIYP